MLLVFKINQSLYVSNVNLVEYADKDNNFSLKYPDSWDLKKEDDPILHEAVSFVSRLSPEYTNIVVIREKLTEPMTLSSYMEKRIKELKNTSNFKQLEILQKGDAIFANRTARMLIYTTIVDNGRSIKYMETFAMKDLCVYSITYKSETSTYDIHKPVAEKIIHSFKNIP